MKKILLIAVLLGLAVVFCGCGGEDEDSSSSESTASTPSTPSMPSMPGSPSMSGGPSTPSLPTMPSTPGATAAAAAPAAPAAPAAETKEKKPAPALPTLAHGSASKDDNGEVRVYNAFPEYTGRSSSRPYGADENECREAALAFVRAYYYEFDSMSFQYRNVPGKWLGNRWRYTFTQIIRDTKRTGNTITIDVNPDYYDAENDMHYPEVVYYKAVKKNWTN